VKIAIVHDYLVQYGGAERVVETMHRLYPTAPIYTALYAPGRLASQFAGVDVRPALRVGARAANAWQRWLLPLYPTLFRRMRLAPCDLVLSSASAFAKAVHPPAGARHVCYCYSPTRYLWSFEEYADGEGLGVSARAALRPIIRWLRRTDLDAARTVDQFVSISREVARRVRAVYGRDSTVVYPPVRVGSLPPPDHTAAGDYYLVASRLVPYKRIEVAIEACNRLRLPLIVVGEGRLRAELGRLAGPTVRLVGRVSEPALLEYFRHCIALIFPGSEDFGIVPVEAMAHGKPVIALAAGGALETVVEGVSGTFFRAPTADALVECLRAFRPETYDPREIRRVAERFDESVFDRGLAAVLSGEGNERATGPSRSRNGSDRPLPGSLLG
jgi:glycosyltransferase involved in cell wall biosynthesis